MNIKEFSDAFGTLLNSYNSQAQFGEGASAREIVLDEYEKSLFLTKAQQELVINIYNGKNPYGDSFESTEEMRRYLENLVKTRVYSTDDQVIKSSEDQVISDYKVSDNSVFYELPDNIAFITMEQVTYNDESLGCADGSRANVYPVTQDEYSRVKDNPFRGPTRYKVLRLDYGNNIVELVSKYVIGTYLIRYLTKPSPIILEDLPNGLSIDNKSTATECQLNSMLHNVILERAVALALSSKGISVRSE